MGCCQTRKDIDETNQPHGSNWWFTCTCTATDEDLEYPELTSLLNDHEFSNHYYDSDATAFTIKEQSSLKNFLLNTYNVPFDITANVLIPFLNSIIQTNINPCAYFTFAPKNILSQMKDSYSVSVNNIGNIHVADDTTNQELNNIIPIVFYYGLIQTQLKNFFLLEEYIKQYENCVITMSLKTASTCAVNNIIQNYNFALRSQRSMNLSMYIKHVALLCFDLTCIVSFRSIIRVVDKIEKRCLKGIIFVLVGFMFDNFNNEMSIKKREDAIGIEQTAMKFAKEWNITYIAVNLQS